ncbi:MAG: MATE family efflux transporter [Acidaminococcaceae bacterium]|nr:MATE family efflux transporter [Acidaminococcaceae bacterium]
METDNSKEAETNILGYEPIEKLLKMFAGPAIVSMVASSLYNIIDQIFIGHAVGYLGIAATTIAFPLVTIVMSVGTLLGVGGSAFAAIKLGEGKPKDAQKILNTVAAVLLLVSFCMVVVGLTFLEPILTLFGATEATMLYSKQFSSVMIAIIPLTTYLIALANMARTDGSPRLSMRALVGGVLINIILAPIFIFGFGWGVLGAALATACAQLFSVIVLLWYFIKESNMRLNKYDFLHPHKELLTRVLAIGASSGLVQLSATILQIVLNNSLLYYGNMEPIGGDAAIGAMGIVMKVNMVFISICIGIGIGSQPIVGFNRGAEKYSRVKATYKMAAKLATIITCIGWFCCMFIPHTILQIFGSGSAPGFLDFATDCMRLFLGGVFTAGFQIISTSYFQATGQPLKASILSLMRQFILLLPLIIALPFWFGLYGVLYAGVIADLISATVVFVFIHREMKKLSRLIES